MARKKDNEPKPLPPTGISADILEEIKGLREQERLIAKTIHDKEKSLLEHLFLELPDGHKVKKPCNLKLSQWWYCPSNSARKCVYPARGGYYSDCCLFCGEPSERK